MHNHDFWEEAVPALRENLDTIHTVAEWAAATGYSRAYFSILVRQKLEEAPSAIIRREKFKKVKRLVRENPTQKGHLIAKKTGFKNVKSLYKFLRRHFDTTLTAIRKGAKNSL
ncbi:MAG: AraC family transcriptional regulator [Balneolaceae bacterium]|nr:AraC family transcriptional regulator [Balneolaceae bacterium]